jgi:hypothetical protein
MTRSAPAPTSRRSARSSGDRHDAAPAGSLHPPRARRSARPVARVRAGRQRRAAVRARALLPPCGCDRRLAAAGARAAAANRAGASGVPLSRRRAARAVRGISRHRPPRLGPRAISPARGDRTYDGGRGVRLLDLRICEPARCEPRVGRLRRECAEPVPQVHRCSSDAARVARGRDCPTRCGIGLVARGQPGRARRGLETGSTGAAAVRGVPCEGARLRQAPGSVAQASGRFCASSRFAGLSGGSLLQDLGPSSSPVPSPPSRRNAARPATPCPFGAGIRYGNHSWDRAAGRAGNRRRPWPVRGSDDAWGRLNGARAGVRVRSAPPAASRRSRQRAGT